MKRGSGQSLSRAGSERAANHGDIGGSVSKAEGTRVVAPDEGQTGGFKKQQRGLP